MGKTVYQVRIEQLFAHIDETEQVCVLVSLYWKMTDAQKDKFLKETENA